MQGDEQAIARWRAAWLHAMNAGNIAQFLDSLMDDVVWLPAGSGALVGRDAIRRWLESLFAQFDYECTTSREQVRLAGRWEIERGGFQTMLTAKGQHERLIRESRYLLL